MIGLDKIILYAYNIKIKQLEICKINCFPNIIVNG